MQPRRAGCCKTTLARAAAGATAATFLPLSGAQLQSMYVGEGEAALRRAFARARLVAPSVIFIDELDSVAGAQCAGTEQECSWCEGEDATAAWPKGHAEPRAMWGCGVSIRKPERSGHWGEQTMGAVRVLCSKAGALVGLVGGRHHVGAAAVGAAGGDGRAGAGVR